MKKIDVLLRLGVLILLSVTIFIFNSNFGKLGNIINIIRQGSLLYVLGIGMTMVIIVGGVDLSNGSVLALTSCIFALCFVAGVPIPIAMIIAMVLGLVCGITNGILVTYGKIPPFVATFAMAYITRGLAYFLMHSNSIQGFNEKFRFIATGHFLGIPMPIIWALLLFIVFHTLMEYTPFGVNVYAIGSNKESSRLAGIKTNKTIIIVYALNGLLTAFAGLIYTARLNNAEPVIGGNCPLQTIAAVIIGGTSQFGGEGKLTGTIIGVLILATILNGMNLMGIPSLWQSLITGSMIILMIGIQIYTKQVGFKNGILGRVRSQEN